MTRRLFSAWLLVGLLTAAAPAELPPAPEGAFTLAVLPDTQHYYGRCTKTQPGSTAPTTNKVFTAYAEWVADNLDRQRVVFVSHTGDIVDLDVPEQWEVARRCMDLFHGRVPYAISPGNHDMKRDGDTSLFQKYFPHSRYAEFDWYGGTFENGSADTAISGNNANSYQFFSAEGLDFIILHIECNAPDDVLAWADEVLRKHPDRRAIVATHMYLGPRERPKVEQDYFDAPKGVMRWAKCHGKRGNTAQQSWDECYSKQKNLFLICCGDQSRSQAMHLSQRGEHGNTVHAVLSDYGANGLRLYNFRPKENRIVVTTYNPYKNQLCQGTKIVPDPGEHQFTLDYDMTSKP